MNETNHNQSDHIICTEFDGGEGLLVDLNTRRYYQLNETALLIWKGLEKRQAVAEIVAEVVAGYDVTPAHAERSVENLMGSLRSYRLLGEF